MTHPPLKLFHRIPDADSAKVRRMISDYGVQGVAFKNIDVNDEARAELIEKTGSAKVPALLVGEDRWFFGSIDIEAYLNPND